MGRTSYSMRSLIESWNPSKRAQDRREPLVFLVMRPLSFPVAWLALRIGLTANHISVVAIGLNLVGLGMLAFGRAITMLAGIGVMCVALIFDCADGTMARTTKKFTSIGEWLDAMSAYLLYVAFHLCGGIGAWMAVVRGAPVSAWPKTPVMAGVLIVLGGLASASLSLGLLVGTKFGALHPSVARDQLVDRLGRGWYGVLFTIGRNLSFPSGLVLPITFAGILFYRYELVLAFYATLNVAILLNLVVRCLRLAKSSGGGISN
jgi:phosphatidylglycerophosphate synthase